MASIYTPALEIPSWGLRFFSHDDEQYALGREWQGGGQFATGQGSTDGASSVERQDFLLAPDDFRFRRRLRTGELESVPVRIYWFTQTSSTHPIFGDWAADEYVFRGEVKSYSEREEGIFRVRAESPPLVGDSRIVMATHADYQLRAPGSNFFANAAQVLKNPQT